MRAECPLPGPLTVGAAMQPVPARRSIGRRLLWTLAVYPLIGGLAAVLVGLGLSVTIDPRTGAMSTAAAFDGESNWTATQWRTPFAVAIESTRNTGGSWSP